MAPSGESVALVRRDSARPPPAAMSPSTSGLAMPTDSTIEKPTMLCNAVSNLGPRNCGDAAPSWRLANLKTV